MGGDALPHLWPRKNNPSTDLWRPVSPKRQGRGRTKDVPFVGKSAAHVCPDHGFRIHLSLMSVHSAGLNAVRIMLCGWFRL